MKLTHGVRLAAHTTLGLGGLASHWVEATSNEDVAEALAFARERDLSVHVLGGGSNVLAADGGVRGVVLRVRCDRIAAERDGNRARVVVGAGTRWDELVAWTVAHGYAGLECLSGIPGDVGAAPIQNIGAYGQEVGDVIESVEVVCRNTGAIESLSREACAFGYRESVFKQRLAEQYVVVGVTFALTQGPPHLEYAELSRALAHDPSPTLSKTRESVLALRRAKSMLLDERDPNGRSAGSFFVNPTVSPGEADAVEARARTLSGPMPRFAHGERVKLSAGWLIERAGLSKGTRRGAVGLSTKHCLAIVNLGGATAADVIRFAREVKAQVFDTFGVSLTPEPRPMGFVPGELDGLYD